MNTNYELEHLKDYIFADTTKTEIKEKLLEKFEGNSLKFLGEDNDILFTRLFYNNYQNTNSKFDQKILFKLEESSDETKILCYIDKTNLNRILKIFKFLIPLVDVVIFLALLVFIIGSGNSLIGGMVMVIFLITSLIPFFILKKVFPKTYKSGFTKITDRLMQNLFTQ